MILIILAIVATALILIQNLPMLALGFKELAILAFPLSFVGIFVAEIVLTWVGVIAVRRFFTVKRDLLFIAWMLFILGMAELLLPVSYFSNYVRHAQRRSVLNKIEVVGRSVEVLASDHEIGSRFGLAYSLKFPKSGHYLTFPAYIGSNNKPRVSGGYFRKVHPEYYEEEFAFEPDKPYEFIVVFDSGSEKFDFPKEKANIQICDGKDYFMTCRTIEIEVGDLLRAFLVSNPSPTAHEPSVPADNFWDIAEKSIRSVDLKISPTQIKTGQSVEFSFAITNIGEKDIAIPDEQFGSLIHINYGWEAISDEAKKTKVIPGIIHFGNSVAAGGAQFTNVRKSNLSPGEKVLVQDKVTQPPAKPGA
jgi:hypothetical protein